MKEFTGRTAVVTGAASGIGFGLAQRFARDGMNVVLADVEQRALDRAASELAASGAKVLAVRTDVADYSDVLALASQASEAFGNVHVLCNNAGVGGGGPLSEVDLDEWSWVINVNLFGAVHGIRAFLPAMLAHGEEGHIVNTASMAGVMITTPGNSAYASSKAAIVALSEILHLEMASQGTKIGVSVVCPGSVDTRIVFAARNRPGATQSDGNVPTLAQLLPDAAAGPGGFSSPAEIADIVHNAIRDDIFYVLTHPLWKDGIRERTDAMLNGGKPRMASVHPNPQQVAEALGDQSLAPRDGGGPGA